MSELTANQTAEAVMTDLDIDSEKLQELDSWTLVILEDLKAKADSLSLRRLRYVLSTAMPIVSGFALRLNGEVIESAKAEFERVVEFSVADLPKERIEELTDETAVKWTIKKGALTSDLFPSGITGFVEVTDRSLKAGKSADLGRSHGFFVKVRGRLVGEEDPLFGLHPLSHETLNRFRAEISADDLDEVVTAPREDVEESLKRNSYQGSSWCAVQ